MDEITSLQDLAQKLNGKHRRIGIDGTNGARKSSVATFLSTELDVEAVHLDNFLIKNEGGYVNFLRYDELGPKLHSLQSFVVEGVCLLQVLERIGLGLDVLIYVKRYHLALWADERELEVPADMVEDFLVKERKVAAMLSGEPEDDGPSMADDIVRYHTFFKPHQRAQFVYRWDDL